MFLSGVIPLSRVAGPELGRVLPDVAEAHLGEIVLPIVVDRSGDVPPAHLGSSLTRILGRRTGIDQDRIMGGDGPAHLLERSSLRNKRT